MMTSQSPEAGRPPAGTADVPPRGRFRARGDPNYQLLLAIISNVLTIVALVFIWQQTHEIAQQNSLAASSAHSSSIAAEMQFNLQVMERADDVLMIIATDPECYGYVWGKEKVAVPDNSKAIQCGDSLIDILSMALKGVKRLPCFSMNEQDWSAYTSYVMNNSPNLRYRVIDQPIWWPEVTPFAQQSQAGVQPPTAASAPPDQCR
jgi:hypothetical protein